MSFSDLLRNSHDVTATVFESLIHEADLSGQGRIILDAINRYASSLSLTIPTLYSLLKEAGRGK